MKHLHEFYSELDTLMVSTSKPEGIRYGQTAFNLLLAMRPDLAEVIRGSDKDPFYIQCLSDPKWDRFVEYINTNWYQADNSNE